MKKVLLKSLCSPAGETKIKPHINAILTPRIATIKIVPAPAITTNTYVQRKSHQSIYEDIFKLLMRIPDKALQQRVIDAINGTTNRDKTAISTTQLCKQCSRPIQSQIKTVNAETQTSTSDTSTQSYRQPQAAIKSTEAATTNGNSNDTAKTPPKGRKRGRKPNKGVPQVVKKSIAQMVQKERDEKQLTAVAKKPRIESPKTPATTETSPSTPIEKSTPEPAVHPNEIDIDLLDTYISSGIDNYIKDNNMETIRNIMAKEYKISDQVSPEGYMPIHDAIVDNDSLALQRQIYVWSKLKSPTDLNELLTTGNEDCLQLAVFNDCSPEIISIVLKAGILSNHVYEQSNHIIHLAVLNNINVESVRTIMNNIDLNLLLLTNDDGYTALHLAVKYNRYYMAEVICDIIDERENGKPLYNRPKELTNGSEIPNEKAFGKYYDIACHQLDETIQISAFKQKFLNATEKLAGNVALFHAIEGEYEHLCYFLLAHLADPEVKNRNGYSPKLYHYDFARCLRLNLQVSRMMDKVINLKKK